MNDPTLTVDAVDGARILRGLLCLRAGADQGWYRYLAAGGYRHSTASGLPPAPAKNKTGVDCHYVQYVCVPDPGGVGPGWQRELEPYEVEPWVRGVAAARSSSRLLPAEDVATPALLTIQEAAAVLGVKDDGVKHRIERSRRTDPLECILVRRPAGGGHVRRVLAAQVHAQANRHDPAAAAAWAEVRDLLPARPTDQVDVVALRAAVAAAPVPALAIPESANREMRAITALTIGHEQGWFRYVAAARDRQYLVDVASGVPGERVEMLLDEQDVLPWVLGHADRWGLAHLVAYRPGLGEIPCPKAKAKAAVRRRASAAAIGG